MSSLQFSQVSLNAKANVSDDGRHLYRVLSFADGHQKILGCLVGGDITHFVITTGTASSESMEILQGECQIQVGDDPSQYYREGQSFVVSSNTKLIIETDGLVQYVRHLEG